MRAMRVLLAIITAGWGLSNLFPLIGTIGIKLDWFPLPPDLPANFRVLAAQIPWWGLAVWVVMVVLYLVVARALLRDRPAFGLFVAALATELVRWVPMSLLPAYSQTWSAGELRFRYIAWAVLVLIGAIIWWVERRRSLPAQAV